MKESKLNNKDKFSIENKVIAIIGSTGILGSEYVKYLSSLGATIIIGDIDYDKCVGLSKEVSKLGFNAVPMKIDNTSEESIENFFSSVVEKFSKVDVLINNAQIKPDGFYDSFENYSKKTLSEVLDGNLIGVAIACREACKIFIGKGISGVIINVASIYGIVAADQRIYKDTENIYLPMQKMSSPVSYAISKAGVVQLTKYLASYYREKNIRINCLTPGGVYDNHDKNFEKKYSERTLIGRMANKSDYNAAILFLCSDASSYMTGGNLIIDGGWSAT